MTRVLFAEDSPGLHDEINKALSKEGYEVTAAIDGEEAIQKLRRQEVFDVLWTDLNMPAASGGQVIEAAGDMGKLPKVTVLYTSSVSLCSTIPEGVIVVSKSSSVSEVCRIIRNQLVGIIDGNLENSAAQYDVSGFQGDLKVFVLHLLRKKYLKSQAAIDAFHQIIKDVKMFKPMDTRGYVMGNTRYNPEIKCQIDLYNMPEDFGMKVTAGAMVRDGIAKTAADILREEVSQRNAELYRELETRKPQKVSNAQLVLLSLLALGISVTLFTDQGRHIVHAVRDAISNAVKR